MVLFLYPFLIRNLWYSSRIWLENPTQTDPLLVHQIDPRFLQLRLCWFLRKKHPILRLITDEKKGIRGTSHDSRYSPRPTHWKPLKIESGSHVRHVAWASRFFFFTYRILLVEGVTFLRKLQNSLETYKIPMRDYLSNREEIRVPPCLLCPSLGTSACFLCVKLSLLERLIQYLWYKTEHPTGIWKFSLPVGCCYAFSRLLWLRYVVSCWMILLLIQHGTDGHF